MRVSINEIKLSNTPSNTLKRQANLAAIGNVGSYKLSARKMRRIEQSMSRKAKKSIKVANI
jgi:hypothetical protein